MEISKALQMVARTARRLAQNQRGPLAILATSHGGGKSFRHPTLGSVPLQASMVQARVADCGKYLDVNADGAHEP